MSLQSAFQLAGKQIGLTERDQRAAIQDYLTTGGANLDPATTAWCAAFVNATLEQTGVKGTGSNMARSFLDWGQEVSDPQRGDLAVFSRGDPNGPYGHVGFFDGYNPDGTIRVLGGNQGAEGSVSLSNYSPDRLLGFRRAEGEPQNAFAGSMAVPMGSFGVAPQQNAFRFKSTQLDPAMFMSNAFARS
ncbi:MAG: TIGR02594 family protein [Paracoccaceae bacterium]